MSLTLSKSRWKRQLLAFMLCSILVFAQFSIAKQEAEAAGFLGFAGGAVTEIIATVGAVAAAEIILAVVVGAVVVSAIGAGLSSYYEDSVQEFAHESTKTITSDVKETIANRIADKKAIERYEFEQQQAAALRAQKALEAAKWYSVQRMQIHNWDNFPYDIYADGRDGKFFIGYRQESDAQPYFLINGVTKVTSVSGTLQSDGTYVVTAYLVDKKDFVTILTTKDAPSVFLERSKEYFRKSVLDYLASKNIVLTIPKYTTKEQIASAEASISGALTGVSGKILQGDIPLKSKSGNPVVWDGKNFLDKTWNRTIPVGQVVPAIPVPKVSDKPITKQILKELVGADGVPKTGSISTSIGNVTIPKLGDLLNPNIPSGGGGEAGSIDFSPLWKGLAVMQTKFPFSLPWDVAKQLAVFNVTPTTPVLKVDVSGTMKDPPAWIKPFKFTLDLSVFDPVAVIGRWFFIIIGDLGFIFMLRRLTAD